MNSIRCAFIRFLSKYVSFYMLTDKYAVVYVLVENA